jgi:nucleotide-binding universal stress UspA family protein
VTPPVQPPFSALAETVAGIFEPQADAEETVRRFVEPLGSATGVPVEVIVRDGDAAETILACAQETSPDLVTIGTHGLSALEKAMLGSVATTVLRGSRHPVLAVRAPAVPQDPFESVPFESVLVPVDFSHASVRALEHAYAMAQEVDAQLVLLHVVEETRSEAETDAAERRARRRLREILPEDAQLWCEPDIVVTHGPVAEAIGRIADEWGSQLVVLGALGRDGHSLGAHVEGVLQRVRCPVLVAPAPSASSTGTAELVELVRA